MDTGEIQVKDVIRGTITKTQHGRMHSRQGVLRVVGWVRYPDGECVMVLEDAASGRVTVDERRGDRLVINTFIARNVENGNWAVIVNAVQEYRVVRASGYRV